MFAVKKSHEGRKRGKGVAEKAQENIEEGQRNIAQQGQTHEIRMAQREKKKI